MIFSILCICQKNTYIWLLCIYPSRDRLYFVEKASVRDLAGQDFLRRFEKIFGPIITAQLESVMHYAYFGTDDIASIIQSRPELFERAMSEIFGGAWPAILSMTTTSCFEQTLDEKEASVSKLRFRAFGKSDLK